MTSTHSPTDSSGLLDPMTTLAATFNNREQARLLAFLTNHTPMTEWHRADRLAAEVWLEALATADTTLTTIDPASGLPTWLHDAARTVLRSHTQPAATVVRTHPVPAPLDLAAARPDRTSIPPPPLAA